MEMTRRDADALDRHITGNWGEDSVGEPLYRVWAQTEPERGLWRPVSVPMTYAEATKLAERLCLDTRIDEDDEDDEDETHRHAERDTQ